MTERVFAVRFILGEHIQTHIESKNVSPQEAIGLLEMAKDQLMSKLRTGTKNLVDIRKRDDKKDSV